MDAIRELVKKLTELTRQNKLIWNYHFLNSFSCVYRDWEVTVDWVHDDKPTISINDAVLREYGCGIENLMSAVRFQNQRKRLAEPLTVKDVGQDNFNKMAKAMLQRLNSEKRRKR